MVRLVGLAVGPAVGLLVAAMHVQFSPNDLQVTSGVPPYTHCAQPKQLGAVGAAVVGRDGLAVGDAVGM